jgi:serine/threonine protein phosphatase PrpC
MSGTQVPLGQLYIVADGMGGHKGGALAAQMAVDELQRHISQAAVGSPPDAVVEAAFKAANDAVYQKAHSGDASVEGMGTTAVLLLVSGRTARLAHVGDSRAYLFRDGTLSRLTKDHTVVQRMVEAGMLKPDEAADHPQSSVLERAIGSASTVQADIASHELQEGDALLLCSDGLCGYVPDSEIEGVLHSQGPVQETTANLVDLALAAGGRDNVTVQLIRYGARKPAAPSRQTRPAKALPSPTATTREVRARPGRGLLSWVATFVAGAVAAVATAGILGYIGGPPTDGKSVASETERLRRDLEHSTFERERLENEVAELRRERAAARQPTKPEPVSAEPAKPAAGKGERAKVEQGKSAPSKSAPAKPVAATGKAAPGPAIKPKDVPTQPAPQPPTPQPPAAQPPTAPNAAPEKSRAGPDPQAVKPADAVPGKPEVADKGAAGATDGPRPGGPQPTPPPAASEALGTAGETPKGETPNQPPSK